LPTNASFPGVHVAENPSGLHRITGVPTSIAAFVGWSARGFVDRALSVRSFADFARTYGGLDSRSLLGYAVRHFFDNGGRDAVVVRVAAANATSASAMLDGKLNVLANSPGAWANEFAVEIRAHANDPALFSLALWHRLPEADAVMVERFDDLALINDGSSTADDILAGASAYVQATRVGSATDRPADTPVNAPVGLAGGFDGDVLAPDTAAFERQLPADGTGGAFGLLDKVDLVNLVAVPGESTPVVIARLQSYCRRRRAFCLVDCPEQATLVQMQSGPDPNIAGVDATNAALYFPWVAATDPLLANQTRAFPPSGFVAGIYARMDAARGVWKAPAGNAASIAGAAGAAVKLDDQEQGTLNPRGINVIREFPTYGTVVWGARTLAGSDANASQWKYVPLRRLALFIEASLQRGTQWVVFEPNGESLWSQIRNSVGMFLHDLFLQGAFQGSSPRDAYFVKCDSETTTPADVAKGVVNVVVGFAPLKPAEFVVITIRQLMDPHWPPG
jgi:phage tail sheath protein FI